MRVAPTSPRHAAAGGPARRPGILLLAMLAGLIPAAANELGHPVFREFAPGESKTGFIIEALAQDRAGHVYSAEMLTLRHYDGTTWRPIAIPPEATGARRLATAADGTIYAGGVGLIGYLRGAGDACEFVSLADRLPPSELGCERIDDVLAAGDAVYFADTEKILEWRAGAFRLIPCRSPPQSHGPRLHRVGESVFVSVPGQPLYRLVDDRLEEVADDAVLRENAVVLLEPGPAGGLTALTDGRGFFHIEHGRAAQLEVEANRWLANRKIWRAQRMRDGSLAVVFTAPSGRGGMRFDPGGRYVGPLDETLGLYTRALRSMAEDYEGGLWLGTDMGTFRMEWPSGVSVFDSVNGLGAGRVACMVRHHGVPYAATDEGVFRLVPMDESGRVAHFERIYRQPVSALLSHPTGLLALGYAELLLLAGPGFVPVAATPPGAGLLKQSEQEPDRVWVGAASGLFALRRTPAGWRNEGLQLAFGATAAVVRPVADGSLWVATGGNQGFRVDLDPANGKPAFRVGAARSAAETGILAECAAAPLTAADMSAARWVARSGGVEWVPAAGGEVRRLPQLAGQSAGTVACLLEERSDEGTVLWIGGTKGLVRVEVARAFPAPVAWAALLTATGVADGGRLAPEHAPLRFDYVALRHQIAGAVRYQTRLVGVDAAWSDWTEERTRNFVRLPAGNCRFEVRARDADGNLSAPASLAFTVSPPWWGTVWARLGATLVGLGLIGAVVHLRTRALHQRAERLEGIVAARTAELARQNAELVRLNQLELDEKISARLAEEKARLEMLRYQLNPHFLFNTLASISASLPSGQSTARTMVDRLGEFCRLTLHRADESEQTTLDGEMKLLRTYLQIEQSRWGDLLEVEVVCDEALAGEQLPHFLLLPLVENALKYGRATSPDRVGLRIHAGRGADGALVLTVANTGEWIEPSVKKSVSSLGIGLENLRERLARHYPRAHQLDIAHADGWVIVTLRILKPPVV